MTGPWATYTFKHVQGVAFQMDVYLPSPEQLQRSGRAAAPVLVYYHGGGLCLGDRGWNDWVGRWMFYDAVEAGIAVISCDYTLLGPHTGEEIIEDVKDALIFIRDELNGKLEKRAETSVRIDPTRVAVSGASGGGCVAYYAAIHSPYPLKAVIGMYAGGGDLLSDWYLQEKTEPFFPGVPLLPSSAPFDPLLNAPRSTTPPTLSTPLADPDSPRTLLLVWLLQRGTLVDLLSGVAGASAALRALPAGEARERLAAESEAGRRTLPQLVAAHPPPPGSASGRAKFPPTFLAHGTADAVVALAESRNMHRVLRAAGTDCVLWEVEGGAHGFDTDAGWANSPGARDPELTRRKDEGLRSIIPWLVEQLGRM
ncbi:hypothetical protein JCM3770_001847 [Rhodotorula araucariae]